MLKEIATKKAHCPEHGKYLSKKFRFLGQETEWSGCFQCDCLNYIKTATPENREIVRRRAELGGMRDAGIPLRFQDRRLENFKTETRKQHDVLRTATDYAENFGDVAASGRSLLLCGYPGTGKTHIAVGIGHRVMTQGGTVAFTSVMNAVRRIRESYDRGGSGKPTVRQAIQQFADPDLLILDEVGQQRGTDDELVLIYDIINARYEAVRPTIVISNLNAEDMRRYLGDRAFDRLREGGGRALQFDWESYRRNL